MDARSDGSFALNPADPDDPDSTLDTDVGPRDISMLPADLPMKVYDSPASDEEVDSWDGDDARYWFDVTYRPFRGN